MVKFKQLTIPKAIKKAKKAIKKGHISAAQQLYNAILQHQPNHPVAKKGLRKLVKNLPRNQSFQTQTTNPSKDRINALISLYSSGQFTKAEQVCKELLQTFPQSLNVINILGAALKGQNKLQEAVQAFDKAIQLKPDYAEAYYNSGNALKDLGQLKEAVNRYNKAIQIKPDYPEAYNNRGTALKDLGQLNKSIESYKTGIKYCLKKPVHFTENEKARGAIGEVIPKQAILDINAMFTREKIQFFPCKGTALGFERIGNFLNFDKDVDIGVMDISIEKLDEMISADKNFAFDKQKTIPIQEKPLNICIRHKSGLAVDIFLHYRINGKFITGFTNSGGNLVWVSSAFELHPFIIFETTFFMPVNIDLYLTELYGDWRTPDTRFDPVISAYNLAEYRNGRIINQVPLLAFCSAYNRLFQNITRGNKEATTAYCEQILRKKPGEVFIQNLVKQLDLNIKANLNHRKQI